MGKKVQKPDKGPPEDVFEPLIVEGKQTATVVLMLKSQEEEVLAKACEAIYKFVDKSDDNKKTLLDLEVIDPLLDLLHHEDKLVRRNACMAFGVLSTHVEVRRVLRKRPNTIPIMISLIGEEETILTEFACLCLASLANDYSAKVSIFENDGLEPLINCLSNTDPDVQKNAIEAISLMMQDYQTKTGIRVLNGFQPVLDLISSEYPVIQHLALVTLQRATEDVENRAVLREIEALDVLLAFIGHPEWQDLHVFAVQVLANCLEDTENMQQIKDMGGLQKLVALITDTTPPEDEDAKPKGGKGAKGDKGAGKGKKGKEDAGSARTPTPKKGRGTPEKSAIDAIIPTLPEVKEATLKALTRAARIEANKKILHAQEVEKMMITFLSHENLNVQIAAAQAIAVMAESIVSRDFIGSNEGIEPLIKLARSEQPDVREAAVIAISNLTTNHNSNCNECVRYHGLEPLVSILGDSKELAVAHAAVALTNMSCEESFRAQIVSLGVVTALIKPLQSPSVMVQSKACLAMGAFVTDLVTRQELKENHGLEPLLALVSSPSEEVRRNASWTLTVCAVDNVTATAIIALGGLEILQDIQQSSARKNAFTEVAVKKLLNSNITAKYALQGKLGVSDIIEDGFVDVGALKPNTKIKTLEEYCKAPVDTWRPILLINAKAEKPHTPAPAASDQEAFEKASKQTVGGRSSRTGKEKHSKKKEKEREKEKQQQQEEKKDLTELDTSQPEEVGPWTAPGDQNLVNFIEEIQLKMVPLPTLRDQVVYLAEFVGEKMGGPVDRGSLTTFQWEMPIAQLKFDQRSNVLPIGLIKLGIHYHRALLFKALADRTGISCTLVRGQYNRAWNEVFLIDEDNPTLGLRLPPKAFIVDLMHKPGRLMPLDSQEAANYTKL